MNNIYLEIFGYIGTALVIISMMMTSVLKLRIINMCGGVISLIYHLVEKITWSNQSNLFKVSNCSVHVLNTETMQFEIKNKTDFLL